MLCERAVFNHRILQKSNQIRVLEEEVKALKQIDIPRLDQAKAKANDNADVSEVKKSEQSEASKVDSVLDASVQIIAHEEKSVAEYQPEGELNTVEDLKWQHAQDRKAHKQILELHEKKIAEYVVKIAVLEKSEVEQLEKIAILEKQIVQMQEKLKEQCDDINDNQIENEKLQFKLVQISENVVGLNSHEKI